MRKEMTMPRTLAQRMAAGKPEPWIPEAEGDSVTGEIEAIDNMTGDYGPYVVTTIVTEDGTARSVAWFGGVLKGQFEAKRPVVGMTIAIQYLGTKPSKVKGHQDYKDFWVLLDEATRPASAPVAVHASAAPPVEVDTSADEFSGEEPF